MQNDNADGVRVFLHIIFDQKHSSHAIRDHGDSIQDAVQGFILEVVEKTGVRQRVGKCIKDTLATMTWTNIENDDDDEDCESQQQDELPTLPSRNSHECDSDCSNCKDENHCKTFNWSRAAFLYSLQSKDELILQDAESQLQHVQTVEVTAGNSETITAHSIPWEWWHRPIWAWNRQELNLAHGTLAALDFLRYIGEPAWIQNAKMIVSNVKDYETISSQIPSESQSSNPKLTMLCSSFPTPIAKPDDPFRTAVATGEANATSAMPVSQDVDDKSLAEWEAGALEEGDGDDEDELPTPEHENATGLLHLSHTNVPQLTPLKYDETSILHSNTDLPVHSSQPSPQHVAVLTPSPTGTPLDPLEKLQAPSQIDSMGVDLTMLSQLPPNLRSEARLAMALAKRDERKRQRTKVPQNPVFESWLLGAESSKDATRMGNNETRKAKSFPAKARSKVKAGIQRYFQTNR